MISVRWFRYWILCLTTLLNKLMVYITFCGFLLKVRDLVRAGGKAPGLRRDLKRIEMGWNL